MSMIRQFLSVLLLACLQPTIVNASWGDERQGGPSIDFFPNRVTGATSLTGMMAQDAKGRLFASSDTRLVVYDGANWSSHPLPDSETLIALSFGPDGKLWAGARNQVGYYTETPDGAFVFTSLRDELPAEHRQIGFTWGCASVGTRIFFVCQSKVLRWDGVKFTIWDFPNDSRLYPVQLGNELWFTHLETGLYRLTADGPKLEYPSKDLPSNPAFGLERDASGLRIFSRDGLCYAGSPRQQLCSPAVLEFLRTRPLSSVQRLPEGSYALGTLGGLAIISAKGELLRLFTQETGLMSNTICSLFLDREQQLWLGCASSGIARLDPMGAVSLFQRWGQAGHANIFKLAQTRDTLFAISDAGLFRLDKNPGGAFEFHPLEAMPAHISDVAPHRHGLIIGRFGGMDFFDGRQIQSIWETPSQVFWRILPLQRQPDTYLAFLDQKILKITADAGNQWQKQELGELPDLPSACYLDSLDNLWINSAKSHLWHFDSSSRQLTQIHQETNPSEANPITGHGSHVYFFSDRSGYTTGIETKEYKRIAGYPDVTAVQCATSPDGRRLYVAFERKFSGQTVHGLGRLTLDEKDAAGGWAELDVPKLGTVGVPSSLLVTREDNADTLWVGGSESVVRIKPDELTLVRPPARPWLQTSEASGQTVSSAVIPSFAFSKHRLLIRAGTAEIDSRPKLLFQTRLGNGRGEWSQPSPRSSFEFTNLVDGTYTFEIRAVNEAGLTSPPAAYTFRILPPWYRTPWAYAGFAAIAITAVFGYIRFHERRIRERNQQLESLVDKRTAELVKANAAKDEFLAGISHEIRNPMNGVIGIATIIDSSRFDQTTQLHMTQLRHCATHLSSLLEDILDYSRLQAGAVELNLQPFDLLELTDALIALTAAESSHCNIPVEVAVSPTVPQYLVGDAARLRQILLNYLVNALKYSGRGTVCLTVWGQQNLPDQVALTFAVSDDGPGISPEEQARLFTRFERGAAAQTQRVAGTGLGLALCKTLGEKMGGRLWVESEPGHGSTFYFALSLPVASNAPARLHREKPRANAVGTTLQALVVDDEEYNRITLSTYLRELGFQVTTAATGEEALALVRGRNLHAIFLDLNLPGMSGLEIARSLRTMDNVEPSLPIIATTAYTTEEKRRQCSEAGMNAFLTKPVSMEKIRTALSNATSGQRAAASFHAPGTQQNGDQLGGLRLLAKRKGVPLEEEIALYFKELASEERLLADAMKRRDSTTTGDAAHRLVGRLAFIHAPVEGQLARDIEACSMNEFWDQADASAARLTGLLPALREQITAAGSTGPAGSTR